MHKKRRGFSSLFQIVDVEAVGGLAVAVVEVPLPNRAAALKVHDAEAVAVEGVNVAGADTKVTSEGEDVGIGESGERVTIFDEGIAGGGGVGGGGGVLHFLVPLFVFVFALSLKDSFIIAHRAINVKGF